MATIQVLIADLPFDPIKDFTAVSMTHLTPYVVVVSGQSQPKTLGELLKFVKANSGKVTYGTTGPGSPQQLATLLLAQVTGGLGNMTEVPYKGSSAAHPDLIGNRITFMIDPLAAGSGHIRAGSLRALAVTTPQRNHSFPDVPTMGEAGCPATSSRVGRRIRAGRDAARGRNEAQCRYRGSPGKLGHPQALRRYRAGGQEQRAGSVRQVPAGRNQALGRSAEKTVMSQAVRAGGWRKALGFRGS